MELKLAEYKDGKFERFLELGEDFGYFGNGISVYHEINVWDEECQKVYRGRVDGLLAVKDQKDPLNRFDGLFSGRTYGEGRFVLIRGYKNPNPMLQNLRAWEDDVGASILVKMNGERYGDVVLCNIEGNLHENPELYEKINQ